MSLDVFLALLLFAFVSSITPGPNNLMLLASGVNFGFVRTIPHMLGIGIGFLILLLAVGFGLGALLTAYPPIHTALKVVGGAYMLYLAWKIGTSRTMGKAGSTGANPLTFLQAAAFQWVNVKAWVMAVTAMSLYTSAERPFLSVMLVAVAFALVNVPSVATWAGFGTAMRGFLADPVRLKWFNISMGLALALSIVPMVV
jgi:threonine/homoserine/homoserine lactone efflux protein